MRWFHYAQGCHLRRRAAPASLIEDAPGACSHTGTAAYETLQSWKCQNSEHKTHKIIQGFSNTAGGAMKQQPSVLAKRQIAYRRTVVAAPVECILFLCGEGENTGVLRQTHGKSAQLTQRFRSHA